MTKATFNKIINKWRIHYRDEKSAKELFNEYWKFFKHFSDLIAEIASEEVIKSVVSYGRIPQVAEVMQIFEQCLKSSHTEIMAPLPEYDPALAYMNRLFFQKISWAYWKLKMDGEPIPDFEIEEFSELILNWYHRRRLLETEMKRDLNQDERLSDDDFIRSFETWDKRIYNEIKNGITKQQPEPSDESVPF